MCNIKNLKYPENYKERKKSLIISLYHQLRILSSWAGEIKKTRVYQFFQYKVNFSAIGVLTQNFIFKIHLFIYLFMWLCWVFVAARRLSLVAVSGGTLRCGVWASYCSGFSFGGAWALGTWASVSAVHGLSSCGTWALRCVGSVVVAHGLQSTGSVVVAHRLSCFVAYAVFPDQGSNLCPLHWQADS